MQGAFSQWPVIMHRGQHKACVFLQKTCALFQRIRHQKLRTTGVAFRHVQNPPQQMNQTRENKAGTKQQQQRNGSRETGSVYRSTLDEK